MRGMAVEVGQTFITGPSGHIHVRFIDQAFVSVRPNSQMRIEQYSYDGQEPNNNRVKFTLVAGTARWITGKAGQAAKQNFRVNTPVAAIGVRGTDFVVQTTADISRVAVYQGAVVASSFDHVCKSDALGPCAGSAKELAGSLTQQYLEIKPASLAQLVQAKEGMSGKVFAPAAPQEPALGQRSSALPEGMTGSVAVMWGRWSNGGAHPAGYELVARNESFALYRNLEEVHLPKTGNVSFQLGAQEAYARSSQGRLSDATVSDANLQVNFGTMQYATQFKWTSGSHTESLISRGYILSSGRFLASREQSNFSLSGALSASGDEAAYLFMKRLPGDDAYGALHWRR